MGNLSHEQIPDTNTLRQILKGEKLVQVSFLALQIFLTRAIRDIKENAGNLDKNCALFEELLKKYRDVPSVSKDISNMIL